MHNLQLKRSPTCVEERLLQFLVENSLFDVSVDLKDLLVCPMNDGMMGSLYLIPKGVDVTERKFGKEISSFQFTDVDGVEVLVSLNVDREGHLFELDIWKTNFQKLIKLPMM